jgi:hypothetical protein
VKSSGGAMDDSNSSKFIRGKGTKERTHKESRGGCGDRRGLFMHGRALNEYDSIRAE